jgi:hypothetical protein
LDIQKATKYVVKGRSELFEREDAGGEASDQTGTRNVEGEEGVRGESEWV